MAKAVIAYDKELPEIEDRRPWEIPTSYLVKDEASPTGWREEKSGRRPSRLLLVPKIREAVDAWREAQYPGASDVTRRCSSIGSMKITTFPASMFRSTITSASARPSRRWPGSSR